MKQILPIAFLLMTALEADYELRYTQPVRQVTADAQTKSSSSQNSISDKKVLLQNTKGMVIAPDGDRPGDYVIKTTRGTQIYRTMQGISLKNREALKKKLDRLVIGKPLTVEMIAQIKKTIASFYEANGQALVVVNISPNDITDGVVIVTVLEARLGKVTVSGNRWFPTEWYLRQVSLEEGTVVQTGEIDADLAWINEWPWHKASVMYKPGDKYGTTDVEILVQDERPLKLFLGVDNTGFEVTNYNRLFFGINWGNFFNYDHNIAYQYISSPDFSKFQAHLIYYVAPLPNRDEVTLYGVYSSVNVPSGSDGLISTNNTGNEYELSGRYGIFLNPIASTYTHKAKVGFDWKNTNNDLSVSNNPDFSSMEATVLQVMGSYEATWNSGPHYVTMIGEIFAQPWTVGNSMSAASYNMLRQGAATTYFYGKAKAEYVWSEPQTGISLSIKGRLQFASNALIPLETMGLGGVNSVRGYVERVVNVDNGFILNVEMRTPFISVSRNKIPDKLSGVLFLDMAGGGVSRNVTTIGQPPTYYLAGMGPGARYDIGSWVHFRFDLGFRFTSAPFLSSSSSVVWPYFSLVASY